MGLPQFPEPRAGFDELRCRLEEAERALSQGVGHSSEESSQLLAERAAALARARHDEDSERATLEVVAFRVGADRYGVPIENVDEILEIRGLYPLMGAPRQVLGALVARGRVAPVLDLRLLLGLEGGGMSDLLRVIALVDGDERFGLAVEEAEGNLVLKKDECMTPVDGPFLMVAPDRLVVLDVARLIELSDDLSARYAS